MNKLMNDLKNSGFNNKYIDNAIKEIWYSEETLPISVLQAASAKFDEHIKKLKKSNILNTCVHCNGVIECPCQQYQQDQSHRQTKLYTCIYGGMGCVWFVKQYDASSELEGLFMHSDMWGQYGEHTSHAPIHDQFIAGYTEIK